MVDEIIDLFKLNTDEYIAPRAPRLVRNLQASYLTISGTGKPATPAFFEKQKILFDMARALKQAWKDAGQDFIISKLEMLWSIPVENGDIFTKPPEDWQWRQIIRTPYFVQPEDIEDVAVELGQDGADSPLRELTLEPLKEGLCVQMRHEGSFETEVSSMGAMKRFAEKEGLRCEGPHHQIYLSDPKDPNPESRIVILRRPVRE
ncbi:MAG: hypothetical protein EOM20_18255 [Spartobacteria bacterium]|nr:hypothetical protein [Spartobacteria bacterium]